MVSYAHRTPNRDLVYGAITSHLARHGIPPTIREIQRETGISSTAVVNYNLQKLADTGKITFVESGRKQRLARGIRLGNVPEPVDARFRTFAVHHDDLRWSDEVCTCNDCTWVREQL